MKRSRKSNRVSWAPGVNLLQVKLFLADDCPSKIGAQVPDCLQKKTLGILQHSNHIESDDLPPGFEGSHYLNLLEEELSCNPMIEWKCPSKFVMNSNWRVAAGEESQESEAQKLREMRVLEAVYPRPSAIPPCSSVSLDIEDEHYDDSLTPIIPLTPIEEEEAAHIPADLSAPLKTSIGCQPLAVPASEKPTLAILPDPGADLVTAAEAAVTAIMKSKEQGSLIDTNLLVKIFSDPKMIEKLINDHGAPANVASNPIPISKPETTPINQSCPEPTMVFASLPANGSSHHLPTEVQPTPACPKASMPLAPMPANGSLHHLPSGVQPTVTRLSTQLDTVPVSGLRVAPSISLPRSESMVMPSRPAVGNLYSKPNQVQPTTNTLPTLTIRAPKSSFITHMSKPVSNLVLLTGGMMPAQQNSGPQTFVAAMKTNPLKDVNYIKNLIREHGVEKKEMQDRSMSQNGTHYNNMHNMELVQNLKLREANTKFQKACMYFKSSKGCRNGSNCPYQHDLSFQLQTGSTLEVRSAKRIKLGGAITGRT